MSNCPYCNQAVGWDGTFCMKCGVTRTPPDSYETPPHSMRPPGKCPACGVCKTIVDAVPLEYQHGCDSCGVVWWEHELRQWREAARRSVAPAIAEGVTPARLERFMDQMKRHAEYLRAELKKRSWVVSVAGAPPEFYDDAKRKSED